MDSQLKFVRLIIEDVFSGVRMLNTFFHYYNIQNTEINIKNIVNMEKYDKIRHIY